MNDISNVTGNLQNDRCIASLSLRVAWQCHGGNATNDIQTLPLLPRHWPKPKTIYTDRSIASLASLDGDHYSEISTTTAGTSHCEVPQVNLERA